VVCHTLISTRSQFVYGFGYFHQKCNGCPFLFTSAKNIGKTLNPIILLFKFENTLCTLDLNVAQFPSVMENNIQIINICPSKAKSISTNFENNKKPLILWNAL
jgi:hypothetical protein